MTLTPKHIAMLQRTSARYGLKFYPADDGSHVMLVDESSGLSVNFDGESFTFLDGEPAIEPLPKNVKQFMTGAKTGMWLENNATPALENFLKELGEKLQRK
jgi:hypothetical protein